ncbi:MAG TPA: Flp family type IVb pilin [Nitrolancea sp.]
MVQYLSALYGLYAPEVKEEFEGQGMVEYALILVLVSIVAIVALRLLGTTVTGVFGQITSGLGS